MAISNAQINEFVSLDKAALDTINAGSGLDLNPLYAAQDMTADGTDKVSDHSFYKYINNNKKIDLFIGGKPWWEIAGCKSVIPLITDSLDFSFNYNHETGTAFEEVTKQGMGSVLNQMNEALEGARSFLNATNNGKVGSAGRSMSKYMKMPYWKSTNPISFDKDLTFEFHFGAAGLFDALEEVVKPVLGLAACYTPYTTNDGNLYRSPIPTLTDFLAIFTADMAQQAKGFLKHFTSPPSSGGGVDNVAMSKARREKTEKLKSFNSQNNIDANGNPLPGYVWSNTSSFGGGISQVTLSPSEEKFIAPGLIKPATGGKNIEIKYYPDIEGTVNTLLPESMFPAKSSSQTGGGLSKMAESAADLVNAATQLQSALFNAFDHAAKEALLQLKTMTLVMGKMKFQDFYCDKISWKFNLEQVDSSGYPLSGTVSFGGIKRPLMPNAGQVWGMISGLSDKEKSKLDQWQKDLLAQEVEKEKATSKG